MKLETLYELMDEYTNDHPHITRPQMIGKLTQFITDNQGPNVDNVKAFLQATELFDNWKLDRIQKERQKH